MAQNVTINNVDYPDVPAVEVPLTSGLGNALFLDFESYRTAEEQDAIDGSKVSIDDYDPDAKTEAMTQPVGKDENGKLWTVPGGGGGGGTAASISYNPTASGLEADNVQEAIDELADGSDAAAVKYVGQSLSDAQKAQARENINAAAPDGYYGESGGVYQYSTNFLGRNAASAEKNMVFRPTASTMSGQDWSADSIGGQTATVEKLRGKTLVWNQLVDADTEELTVPSGHKYRLFDKDGEDAIITSTGTAIAVTGGEDMVFDLTQMYGAGNEPATVEEFKAQFPLDNYAYNTGELISLNATGLKTVGFNQLYPDGHIDVLKGLTYKIEGTYTSLKDSANNDVTVTNGEFTPSANDTYTMVGGSCVHIKWSGVRDGDTEEHLDSTLSLPIADYFPDGMKSAGTVYDELTKDKAIKRIGAYTFTGEETWTKEQSQFYARISGNIKGTASTVIPNLVCDALQTRAQVRLLFGDLYGISIGVNAITSVITARVQGVTTISEMATYMAGKTIYYELAEPVETPISPELNLTYRCDDFGTEMLLPQNDDEPITAPMDADIVYQLDYEANIRNNDSLNITKESMDNFIAAFNASGLGRISQTWDGANRRYTYTVVPPAPEPEPAAE